MVARGDLGVEIGDEELPGLQKRIIRTALIKHNRIVATATQMMQSMVENPIPHARGGAGCGQCRA